MNVARSNLTLIQIASLALAMTNVLFGVIVFSSKIKLDGSTASSFIFTLDTSAVNHSYLIE